MNPCKIDMRFAFLLVVASILFIGFVSAAFDLEIEKIEKAPVVIKELGNPAIFDFVITNNGEPDSAEIYSLVSVDMAPKGKFSVPSGESKIEVWAWLDSQYLKRDDLYSFEYEIKGDNQGVFKDKITVRVVSLENVFELQEVKIHPDDSEAKIKIKNTANALLENVDISLDSRFFEFEGKINFKPYEEVEIPIKINKASITRLTAGAYDFEAEVKVEDSSVRFDGTINYLEKEGTSIKTESSGLLIRKTSTTKVNEGNVPVETTIDMKKDVVSRLFTGYSIEPDSAERNGLISSYEWKENIEPGESFSVVSTTNYTFPFVLIVLIILVAIAVKTYTSSSLSLKKSVSLVKTKGGEFALKVTIRAKASKRIDNIEISDRLPHMTNLYEQMGRKPDRIDEKSRRLFWTIHSLNRGEERIFSYIVYSKLRAVGRFELPAAMAHFGKDGEKKEVMSNKAYFISETSQGD